MSTFDFACQEPPTEDSSREGALIELILLPQDCRPSYKQSVVKLSQCSVVTQMATAAFGLLSSRRYAEGGGIRRR